MYLYIKYRFYHCNMSVPIDKNKILFWTRPLYFSYGLNNMFVSFYNRKIALKYKIKIYQTFTLQISWQK